MTKPAIAKSRSRRGAPRLVLALMAIVAMVVSGLIAAPPAPAAPPLPQIVTVVAGWQHSCALTDAGAVWCWGANDVGQLGDGTTVDRSRPVAVVGLSGGVTKIAAGAKRTCAVVDGVTDPRGLQVSDGTLKCWGDNSTGALGDGTTVDRSVPTTVVGASGIGDVAVGAFHTCAVTLARTVNCWGLNDAGQLGNGTTEDSLIPTPALVSDVVGITAGGRHTCAQVLRMVRPDRPYPGQGAECWGDNTFGQLGDGTGVSNSVPVDVSGLSSGEDGAGVYGLAAGDQHTCAKGNSDLIPVKCFGRNHLGQLGDGTTTDSVAPVDVVGFEAEPGWSLGVGSIAAGRGHSCAPIQGSDVVLWCWGSPDPAGPPQPTAQRVPGSTTREAGFVAAGDGHTCMVVWGGRVLCLGPNSNGQLGNATTTDSATPVVVHFPWLVLAPADFDGDGGTNLSVFRPSTSTWFAKDMAPPHWGGSLDKATQWGTDGDIAVPGEYDGDGLSDVAVFRPSNGVWFLKGSAGVDLYTPWGTEGDIPVPGDYDGDLRTDLAVYRPSSGVWFVKDGVTTAFGTEDDIPVPGDYDGNGTTDLALFRPSDGTWHLEDEDPIHWGTIGDIPTPADYDSDGDTDMAVFRPSSGTWFVLGGATTHWGTSGDIPVPGHYYDPENSTGPDGIIDIAVFRPSIGTWFVKDVRTANWGTTDDQPLSLPSAIYRSI